MRYLFAATFCLAVLPVSAILAQSESVISEYTLGGELINRFGRAGVDSGIGNMKVFVSQYNEILTLRDNLPEGPEFLGEIQRFDLAGMPVSSIDVAPWNPHDAPLNGISALGGSASNAQIYIATGTNTSNHNSNGRILRFDTRGSAPIVITPFAPEPIEFHDVLSNRWFSSTRGDQFSDDQMGEFNRNGGSSVQNSFSPTGRSVRHLDLLLTPAGFVGALVAPEDVSSDGFGWKLFDGLGNTLITVNKGTIDEFNPIGFEVRNGFLWTYNKATGSIEKYLTNGLLEQSYPMLELGEDVTDFAFKPDGKLLFTHLVPVPAPATGLITTMAIGVMASRRRR